MMSLLFMSFFSAMLLALFDVYRASIAVFGLALFASAIWLMHHASSTLDITL